MKLSVCMITYNHEKFIAQALEGVFAQLTDFDFEVVVGEDCSNDSTRKIIEEYCTKYPHRLRPLFREKNLGMMRNFTQTINACRGKYIALLEGDDFWTSPLKLQMQVDFLDSHPECSVCHHNVDVLETGDHSGRSRLFHKKPPKPFLSIEDIVAGNCIQTCSVVFRAGLFGEFPDWFNLMPMGDWPLHVLNAQYGSIGYIDAVLGAYRMHGDGSWSSLNNSDILERSIRAATIINTNLGFRWDHILRKQIGRWHFELARISYGEKDFEASLTHAKKSFQSFRFYDRLKRKALIIYLKSRSKVMFTA